MANKWTAITQDPTYYYSDKRVVDENNVEIADVWTTFEDAQLIAAAPDLLEALEQISSALNGDADEHVVATMQRCKDMADNAIAKAKGESSDV